MASAKPRLAISEISTVAASFEEDVAAYRAAGLDGVGIWEFKLGDDRADLALLRESGLGVASCVPAIPTILPSPALDDGVADPEARVAALEVSVRRLAAFEPACVVCLTGPVGERGAAEARRIVVEGLRRVADAAAAAGVRVGVEPVHTSQRDLLGFLHTIPETLTLLREAGRDDVGIVFDTFHLWDTSDVDDQIARNVDRFAAVHVSDRREPTRGPADRVLPGSGVAGVAKLLAALARAGYDGWYDVEIFSDTSLPDSLWELEPDEFARQAREAFFRTWAAAR